jgi:membrane-associated protein
MNIVTLFLDYFLHIDKHLAIIIQQFGAFSYVLLFLVIFMETGFVVTPFLPGDSLLFAAGALASTGSFNIILLWIVMILAAFLGDTANYWIGHFIGPKAFSDTTYSIFGLKIQLNKILKKKYLDKAQAFYDKHGGKAIVLARFVPIVRTFAPFVAGVGKMNYTKFISFNIVGGVLWVSLFVFSGYFFGTIPVVQHNFHYVVVVIVLISLVPILYEWWKAKNEKPQP